MTADEAIQLLKLTPHPEGGHFRETFRDAGGKRGASTAIYYLLKVGEVSHWHRVDAAEVWHFHAGSPLVLTISPNGHDAQAQHLGPNLISGQWPQIVVPAGHWQTATTQGHGRWLDAPSHRRSPSPASRWRRRTGGRRRTARAFSVPTESRRRL